jgi:hypothetical protein
VGFLVLGCAEGEGLDVASGSEEIEFSTPPREIKKASLELRAALTLGGARDYYLELSEDFRTAELYWLASRQTEHLDRVHALVGTQRAEAAREGRLAPIIFHDMVLLRDLILAEPDLETGYRAGGVPDTVARLLEHSRIETRSSMALFDSRLRDLERRLLDPEITSTDGHLSLIETEMLDLHEELVDIHIRRLQILPWLVQFLGEEDVLSLLVDPVVLAWLLAHDDEAGAVP